MEKEMEFNWGGGERGGKVERGRGLEVETEGRWGRWGEGQGGQGLNIISFQEPDDLFETLSQALLNAVDRDALSGWGAVVHIM